MCVCVCRYDCVYRHLSLFILQIHCSLQFHLTLLAVIGHFGKIEGHEIVFGSGPLQPILAEYCHSFEILHTVTAAFSMRIITEKSVFVAKSKKKNSLVCNRDCGGRKAAISLNKALGHVSVCMRLHSVCARVCTQELWSVSCPDICLLWPPVVVN